MYIQHFVGVFVIVFREMNVKINISSIANIFYRIYSGVVELQYVFQFNIDMMLKRMES